MSDDGALNHEIELLIGADLYPTIILGEIIHLKCGAVAINTKLGWTLLGNVESCDGTSLGACYLNMQGADSWVTNLWELDILGIRDPVEIKGKEKIWEEQKFSFVQNINRDGTGRYIVKLPWRENREALPGNREVALKRLHSASKKLTELGMWEVYDNLLKSWIDEGFIERVGKERKGQVHYLPHRAVVKRESLTTPVRPVFDASCRVGKAPSLNDCLYTGENLIQKIPEILLRFREKRVGFVSDIRKAFQMIEVDEEDRDAMRFLWWQDREMNGVDEFRHKRVMFGATCSPFILGCVLHYHLHNQDEDKREFGAKLWATLYVDNCVSSEETQREYEYFRERAVKMLESAKMDLRMWLSNLDNLDDPETSEVSVLGIMWDRKKDQLFINLKGFCIPEKITKRSVLSVIQKIYDPIGFSCPCLLPMKCLLQRSFIAKIKWDERLSEKEATLFEKWCQDVNALKHLRIPRLSTGGVSDRRYWSLHTFTDASIEAFSTVVFLRTEENEMVEVQLLAAKARVAPVKLKNIHRLELMGCLIGARLAHSVKMGLGIDDVQEFYWSDSSTALAWIRRNEKWGTFVHNRTSEIGDLTANGTWRHVPGHMNPADLPSRGCTPSQLVRSKWWEGPLWLQGDKSLWPSGEDPVDESAVSSEIKKSRDNVVIASLCVISRVRYSHSYMGYVRIIGWVRRFLHNKIMQDPTRWRRGPLKGEEIRKAEIIMIRNIQREEFPKEERDRLKGLEIIEDDWGVLRVKTRLTYLNEPMDFKYPLLLPNKRKEVHQLIMDIHREKCHAGVGLMCTEMRTKYWIIKARRTIKKVLHHCYRCRRFTAQASAPEAAPLPLDRIKDAEVFEVTGVDLAGPLFLKNGNKVWIVIFTCAVYRAVHFELVGSLSTRAFVGILEKFVNKFRRPSIIYSDNGKNFRGADNLFSSFDWEEILKAVGVSQIVWKFNPPLAAWWGGWWERLIRVAKDMLKRTLGNRCVNWKELEAVMKTVGETMNMRPLTYASEDPADLEPLTPSLFLHPFGNAHFPESEMSEAQKLRFRFSYVNRLKEELKQRFRREYLALLVNRRPKKTTRPLREGDIVLLGNDNQKRIDWSLGRIIKMIPGADGVCRVALVRTKDGEYTRAIQRLYPLELDEEGVFEKEVQRNVTTRSGRIVKLPKRFQ